jgi:hypothetical protein
LIQGPEAEEQKTEDFGPELAEWCRGDGRWGGVTVMYQSFVMGLCDIFGGNWD